MPPSLPTQAATRPSQTALSPWAATATFGPLCLITLSTLYAAYRSLHWPLLHDAPLMHYVASRLLAGDAPYTDTFDMNMPGTYLIHMLVLSLFGSTDLAWRLFELLWLGFAAVTVWLATRSVGALPSMFAATTYMAFHIGTGPWQMGQRDFLMCPFLMLGTHAFATAIESPRSRMRLIAAGACFGFAWAVKPLAVVLFVMLSVYYFFRTHSQLARSKDETVSLLFGFSIGPALIAAWLISTSALDAWYEIFTRWVPLYHQLEQPSCLVMAITLWESIRLLTPALILALPILVAGRAALARDRLTVLAIATLYAGGQFFVQAKGWPYHTEPFVFFLLTLLVCSVAIAGRSLAHPYRLCVPILFGVLAVPIGLVAIVASQSYDNVLEREKPAVQQLVQDLSAHNLQSHDTVQALDSTTGGIHAFFRLGLRQATRYIYDIQFFTAIDSAYTRQLRTEFLTALRRSPPRIIVVFHNTWIPPYTRDRLATFPAFTAFLGNHYARQRIQEHYTLYTRRKT